MLICAIACGVFATALRKARFYREGWYLASLAALMTIGLLFLLLVSLAGQGLDRRPSSLFSLLGMVFLAFGFIGMHVEFGRILGKLGMTPTLVVGVTTEVASAALGLLFCLMLAPALRWAVAFAMPTAIVLLFDRARKRTFPNQNTLYFDADNEFLVPYRFMATSAVQGISIGMPLGFLGANGYVGPEISSLGCIVASVLAVIVVIVLKTDFNRSIYNVGFVLIAAGLLGAGVFGATSFFVCTVQVTGFVFLDLVLWSLGSYLIKECGQRATWLAACPSAALMLGRACGMALGGRLSDGAAAAQAPVVFCVVAFLALLAALFLSNTENMRTGWGFIRPGGSDAADSRLAACKLIAGESSLTQRELDMLQRLAAGKTRKEISEEMFVSANTVKSHVHNLYRKLDVHSEKELGDYVDQYAKMVSSD